VTIGSNTIEGSKMGSPDIGDGAYIGAGAKIIGGVRIGNGCRIGAGAVVYTDMPDNSVAVCAPTRILTREAPLDNRYYRLRSDRQWEYYLDGKWVIDNGHAVNE
jgi:serine O-acetyltransferase